LPKKKHNNVKMVWKIRRELSEEMVKMTPRQREEYFKGAYEVYEGLPFSFFHTFSSMLSPMLSLSSDGQLPKASGRLDEPLRMSCVSFVQISFSSEKLLFQNIKAYRTRFDLG